MDTLKNKSIKHWIVLICCCGLSASAVGSIVNTVGVFYAPVSEALGVLRGTFALSSTLTLIAIGLGALVAPSLMKKYNFKLLILTGSLLAAGSTVLMAISRSMILFYILGITRGIGASVFNMLLTTTIINKWFDEKNGLATSIVLSFSGIAGAILSPILTSCITTVGWQFTYVILGIITFGLCIPAIIYPFHMDPLEDHLLPYGAKEIKETTATVKKNTDFNPKQISFIVFMIFAILMTAITGLSSHLPGYAESVGISATAGALMLSASMIGNIGSKLIIGTLADYIGTVKATVVMIFVNILSLVLIMLIHTDMIMIFASCIFGSIYGISAVGLSLLTRYYFGNESYTSAYSIVQFGTNLGAAFALTLIGFVYDIFGSYTVAFIIILIVQGLNLMMLKYLNTKKLEA